MNYQQGFDSIINDMDRRVCEIENALSLCVTGTILKTKNNGKTVIYRSDTIDGKRIRKTITSNPDAQVSLARRRILEEELAKLLSAKEALISVRKKIIIPDEMDRVRTCISSFPWFTREQIRRSCTLSDDLDLWANEPYVQSDYKSENKTKVTSKGLWVRSKSELILAEKFYEFGISFRYEQVLRINGIQLIPDFTIRRRDGKIIYWEHEGLTSISEYNEKQLVKHRIYASCGIVPWDNLIVTYDTADGDIDLRVIESEIHNRILI